jgi:hypothetical protein
MKRGAGKNNGNRCGFIKGKKPLSGFLFFDIQIFDCKRFPLS